MSTANNLSIVMNEILRTRTARTQRKIYIAVDLAKAYDNVEKKQLFAFLESRVTTEEDKQILNLIKSLYQNQNIFIGTHNFKSSKGTQ